MHNYTSGPRIQTNEERKKNNKIKTDDRTFCYLSCCVRCTRTVDMPLSTLFFYSLHCVHRTQSHCASGQSIVRFKWTTVQRRQHPTNRTTFSNSQTIVCHAYALGRRTLFGTASGSQPKICNWFFVGGCGLHLFFSLFRRRFNAFVLLDRSECVWELICQMAGQSPKIVVVPCSQQPFKIERIIMQQYNLSSAR